jgi:hypothetical protein
MTTFRRIDVGHINVKYVHTSINDTVYIRPTAISLRLKSTTRCIQDNNSAHNKNLIQ